MMAGNLADALSSACRELGVIPLASLPESNKWIKADIDGDPAGKEDARIKLFADGEGGIVHNWKSGEQRVFFANGIDQLTPQQKASRAHAAKETRQRAESDLIIEREKTAENAERIWRTCVPADASHQYLQRKGVTPDGVRVYHGDMLIKSLACDGALVIGLRDTGGKLCSLKFITPASDKLYLYGAKYPGIYAAFGPKPEGVMYLAEGMATAKSIVMATGAPCAAAMDAGNLPAVAKALKAKFPELSLVVCADNDLHGKGMAKASEAAHAVGASVAMPEVGGMDFNDLLRKEGAEAVKRIIAAAIDVVPRPIPHTVEINAAKRDVDGWPDPSPMLTKVDAEPYPLDALPETIHAAVAEVHGFTKAPVPMVASSALSALSLAIQSQVDIKRADKLSGPSSLFLLTIADSGERKSTCDGFFTQAIKDYESQCAEVAKPKIKVHAAALSAWGAKYGGVKEKIKQLAKNSKPTKDEEGRLSDLENNKPLAPVVPRLLYSDATPEALAYGLGRQWPAGGVVSAEAGIVFGSHGMGKDSVMRNLAMLNQLWDGNSLTIDRKSSESFTVRGARLTVALQVQEPTLREFFTRSGVLARGTGFLARFLVAWPESTQGFRPFTEAPANWPHLAAFNRRVSALLNKTVLIADDGAIKLTQLTMTTEAKAAWVEFHDTIEGELANGGELYDVRDVASKSADNAARLAALFQVFEQGTDGPVGADAFEAASRIAAWHLLTGR